MAKIDISSIQGYADMTPEQKVQYFEAYDFNDNSVELNKARESIKKLTSENAEWKRKWSDKASDDDKKEEEAKTFKEEYDKQMKLLSEYQQKEKLLKNGFSQEEVEKIIKADGDVSVYAEIYSEREKKLKDSFGLSALKNKTASVSSGNGNTGDEEDFGKMLAKQKYSANSKNLNDIKNIYKK